MATGNVHLYVHDLTGLYLLYLIFFNSVAVLYLQWDKRHVRGTFLSLWWWWGGLHISLPEGKKLIFNIVVLCNLRTNL